MLPPLPRHIVRQCHAWLFIFLNTSTLFIPCIKAQTATPIDPNNPKAPSYSLADVERMAKSLGKELYDIGMEAVNVAGLTEVYKNTYGAESYDPEDELDHMLDDMVDYMKQRADSAYSAKLSLEMNEYGGHDIIEPRVKPYKPPPVNDHSKAEVVRYVLATTGSDRAYLPDSREPSAYYSLRAMRNSSYVANANFFNLSVDTAFSAVHVPIPVYNRRPSMLRKIQWSDIDSQYRAEKKRIRDLSWQFFCSESGFMRFFPARRWVDDFVEGFAVDLYDCRNEDWYIDGATNAKNVLIMLDVSGSMLGQRFQIAKQTVEYILETLSDNDFFNIMTFANTPRFFEDCLNDTMIQATLRNKLLMRAYFDHPAFKTEGIAIYETAINQAFRLIYGVIGTPHSSAEKDDDYEGYEDYKEYYGEFYGEAINSKDEEDLDLGENNQSATANITSKEDILRFGKPSEEDCVHMSTTYHGDVLCLTREYLDEIRNGSESRGCNSAIMLITDGASKDHKDLFDQLNPQHEVRVFTFLIGEEATAFQEVTDMACNNNGFMVQVANLADVQEKVQNYIRTMSRPLEANPWLVKKDQPIWTGAFMSRLFNDPDNGLTEQFKMTRSVTAEELNMVTTVAYPVVRKINSFSDPIISRTNRTHMFMGVAGVQVPMSELRQMAPPFRLGANSYTFLVDNNGYVMYHPALRPYSRVMKRPDVDPTSTVTIKPNYKSMDVIELEVFDGNSKIESRNLTIPPTAMFALVYDESNSLRHSMVMGLSSRASTPLKGKVLISMGHYHNDDQIRRVFKQTQSYHRRPVTGSLFTLGFAQAVGYTSRLTLPATTDYKKVENEWTKDLKYRVHPEWRYCMLNDSDTNISKEAAMRVYFLYMEATGKLPDLCVARKKLVNYLLADLQATAFVQSQWKEAKASKKVKRETGVHLVFVSTQSSLIRYDDERIDGILYDRVTPKHELPPTTTTTTTTTSTPFDPDLNDTQRAALEAITTTTMKPIYVPPARDTYIHFADRLSRGPDDPYYKRAFLYAQPKMFMFNMSLETRVFFDRERLSAYGMWTNSSLLVTAAQPMWIEDGSGSRAPIGMAGFEMIYDDFAKIIVKNVNPCGEIGLKENDRTRCFLLDESGYVVYSSKPNLTYDEPFMSSQQDLVDSRYPLGRFFADVSAIENGLMYQLVQNGFYIANFYTDYQSMCAAPMITSAAHRLLSPFYWLLNALGYALQWSWHMFRGYSMWSIMNGILMPTDAFTATFTNNDERMPCDKSASLFTLNPEAKTAKEIKAKPCGQMDCTAWAFVSLVPNTNMIMLVSRTDGEQCANTAQQNLLCLGTGYKIQDDNMQRFEKVDYIFQMISNASDKSDNTRSRDHVVEMVTEAPITTTSESTGAFGAALKKKKAKVIPNGGIKPGSFWNDEICKGATEGTKRERRASKTCWQADSRKEDESSGYKCSHSVRQLPAYSNIAMIALLAMAAGRRMW